MADNAYKRRIANLVAPGMRILHAGCGWDKLDVTRPYKDACTVVGIDLDPRVADMFHSEFRLGSLTAMPFDDASFDLVVSENVVEHLDDPEAAFREMARVLKPGGRMVILTPNMYSYKALAGRLLPYKAHLLFGRIRFGPGHEEDMHPTVYRCNTAAALRRLACANGLDVVAVDFVTNGPTWFATFPGIFEAFHLYHVAIDRWEAARQLRCALIAELRAAEGE